MSKPRMLDLYSKAGGAAMGYYRAGFEVVCVDIEPQPRCPFEFIQDDALTFLREYGDEFDACHGSPPCRDHTALANFNGEDGTAWLLPATRAAFQLSDKPWILENVEGADMNNALMLCGSQFGLHTDTKEKGVMWLKRHRLFESNVRLVPPNGHRRCAPRGQVIGVYGTGDGGPGRGWKGSFADRQAVMGIDWMNRDELANAIPPAYTEYLGRQLIASLNRPNDG